MRDFFVSLMFFSIRLGFNLPFLASTNHNKVKTRNENNNIQASARQCDDSLFPLNFDQDKKPVVKIFQYWVNYSSWREWQVKALAIQCLELHHVFEMPSENLYGTSNMTKGCGRCRLGSILKFVPQISNGLYQY